MPPQDFLDQDKSFNINCFEIGDVIVRTHRAEFKQPVYNENLGITTEVVQHTDGSYLGEPMKFLGVFNRMICIKSENPTHDFDKKVKKLHIDQWGEGWQKYNIPNFDEK